MELTVLKHDHARISGFLEIRCMIASSGERHNIGSNVLSYLSLDPRMMRSWRRREYYKNHAVWESELRYRLARRAVQRKNGAIFARFQECDSDAVRWKALFTIARLVLLIENMECRKSKRVRSFLRCSESSKRANRRWCCNRLSRDY